MKSRLVRFLPGFLFFSWLTLIPVFSMIPGSRTVDFILGDGSGIRWDYIEHSLVFGILAFLFFLWRKSKTRQPRGNFFLFLGTGLVYAILTEVLQIAVPGRTFNPLDALFNAAGFLVVLLALLYIQPDSVR
ncbi:MAG: VanZ family protein [Bacteroidota bacterium]